MAISSNLAQTSIGGPSQTSWPNQPETVSLVVRNSAPAGRSQTWSEGEAVRLVKRAWRMGYRGLAAGLAVMWDTQLSPGDVRALTAAQRAKDGHGRAFFTKRGKTGAPVGGVLSK